jgi:hypothetical protein
MNIATHIFAMFVGAAAAAVALANLMPCGG